MVKKQTGAYRELHEFVLLEDLFISWLVPIFCGDVSRHWLVKLRLLVMFSISFTWVKLV